MKPIRLATLLTVAAAVLVLTQFRPGVAAMVPQTGSAAASASTITLYPVADTYIYSSAPTTNYGAAPTLYVGSQSLSATGRALFRFDLSAIPAGATVVSASFQTYLAQTSSSPATLDVELKRIDAPWQEMTVTWNTQPGYTGANNVVGVGTSLGYYSWNVTSLVQTWVSGASNNGLALMSKNESTIGWRGFASRESTLPLNPPRLVIDYTLPTSTPTPTSTHTATSTSTPTVTPTSTGALTATPTSTPTATTAPAPATIGGRVWHDVNRDGVQDFGEPGIQHVFLNLIRDNAIIATVQSDADGYYLFAQYLQGGVIYHIDVIDASLPLGYILTTCCDPLVVVPQPGQDVRNADFGYAPPPPASIHGRVWEDRDRDGVQDAGEDGIDAVDVDLMRNGIVVATAVTDADGYYLFANLEPDVVYHVTWTRRRCPRLTR